MGSKSIIPENSSKISKALDIVTLLEAGCGTRSVYDGDIIDIVESIIQTQFAKGSQIEIEIFKESRMRTTMVIKPDRLIRIGSKRKLKKIHEECQRQYKILKN